MQRGCGNMFGRSVFGCRDLGAHIDGFSAVVAHTIVVGASKVCPDFIRITLQCSKLMPDVI